MHTTRIFVFIVAALGFALNANAQGGRELIINHFVSDTKVIESHLVVTDVEGKGPTVNLKFYDNDGNIAGSGKELIEPFGKINVNPSKYVRGSQMTGTIHVESSGGNVVAEYWQFYKDATASWKNTTTIGYEAPGYSKLVCPHFVADKEVEAYLVIASASGGDATVNVRFYDDEGRELGKARELVKENGKVSLRPLDYVGGKKTTGVAFIEATGGRVTGEYWQAKDFKDSGKDYQLAVPMAGN